MRFPVLAAVFVATASVAFAQNHPSWTYNGPTGPLAWHKLDPSYQSCTKGKEQSPVDLRGARLNQALKPIEFHYLAGPVTVENNGHTIEVHVNPGSYIVANGVRYDLVQFHFHHPSEHSIKNRLADMELHLVHKSADGKLAVVAVRLNEDRGFPNATLAALWQYLPTRAGQEEKVADMVNPGGMLPSDRGYWTYAGSLTTPPCTEGVRWFVFEQELDISREQLNAFAALYKMNARPTQDLHGRKIEADE